MAGFIAAAALAYHLTAPPPDRSPGRRSAANVLDSIRRRVAADAARASFVHEGRFDVSAAMAELRISGISELTIVGEAREDAAYRLEIEASAPSQEEAAAVARGAGLDTDDLGTGLGLSVRVPRPASVISRLALQVPRRMAVRVDNQAPARIRASSLVSIHLDAIGDIHVTDIATSVTGRQRNGTLVVEQAGAVTMDLVAADATFREIEGPTRITGRSGRSRVENSRGAITIETTNQDLRVTGHAGAIEINATGGNMQVDRPRAPVNILMRRGRLDLTLDRGVQATVVGAETSMTLLIADDPSMVIDARITDGRIQAEELGLTATTAGNESTLTHRMGSGDARVALRARRGMIVLRMAK